MSKAILQRQQQVPQPKILQYQVLRVVPQRGLVVRIMQITYGISNDARFSVQQNNEWHPLNRCHIDVLHTLNEVYGRYIATPKPTPPAPSRPQPSYARYGGVKPKSPAQARFLAKNLEHWDKD